MLPKIQKIERSPLIYMRATRQSHRVFPTLASSVLSKPDTPLCAEIIPLVEIQIQKTPLPELKFLEN